MNVFKVIFYRQVFSCCLVVLAGCVEKVDHSSPIEVLRNYIEISFNAKNLEDKHKMEQLLTGDAKQRLFAWSDEQFTHAFIETKRSLAHLNVLENRKMSDQEVAVTYELTFEEGEGEKRAKISQRKLCVVVQESAAWKIKEVRNIRESIEYLKELSLSLPMSPSK